jgi:PAS domain S-box-containing protein
MDAMVISRVSDGVFLDVNQAAVDTFGFAREEFIGRTSLELGMFDIRDREKLMEILHREGRCGNLEFQLKRKNGERIWILISSSIIDIEGTPCVLSIGRDISGAKAAQLALEKAEEKFRTIFEDAPEGIFQTSKEGNSLIINPAGAKVLGFDSPEEVVSRVRDSGHDVWIDQQERARYVERLEQEGIIRGFICQFRRKDWTPVWVSLTARRVAGADGQTLFYQGFMEDITGKKRLEADLSATNRQLRLLSTINRALTGLEAEDEQTLFSKYCQIIVETGGYLMAWVGLAQDGPDKRVVPLASFGTHANYLQAVDIRWDESPAGQGIVGCAIRTRKVQLSANMYLDERMAPWRAEALKRGFHSAIAMPFQTSESGMACLVAYADIDHRFSDSEKDLMKEVASDLGFGVQTLKTANAKAKFQADLRASLEQTIQVIADTVDQRDPYTAGHERRVADLCIHIAKELGLPDERAHGLNLAARIHDLGKIGIPAEILAKPGRLSEMQFNLIKEHVQLGYELLKKVTFPWPIADIILQHHERLNGSGYPRGLKADELLLESRILAVADVVEAMSSHRPYRPSRGVPTALDEITSQRGVLYDAEVVDACVRLFHERGYIFPV